MENQELSRRDNISAEAGGVEVKEMTLVWAFPLHADIYYISCHRRSVMPATTTKRFHC